MKIAFKATEHHKTHTLLDGTVFKDGEIKDIPDEEAKRLLREFPDNFFDPKKKVLDDIVGDKEVVEKSKDKMVRGGKKKGAK